MLLKDWKKIGNWAFSWVMGALEGVGMVHESRRRGHVVHCNMGSFQWRLVAEASNTQLFSTAAPTYYVPSEMHPASCTLHLPFNTACP